MWYRGTPRIFSLLLFATVTSRVVSWIQSVRYANSLQGPASNVACRSSTLKVIGGNTFTSNLRKAGSGSFSMHNMCDANQNETQCVHLLDLLNFLHGRSLMFVGDSLSQQTYDALVIHALRCGLDVTSRIQNYRLGNASGICFEKVDQKQPKSVGKELRSFYSLHTAHIHIRSVNSCSVNLGLLNVYRVQVRDTEEYYGRTCRFCHLIELSRNFSFVVMNFGLHYRSDHDGLRLVLSELKNLMRLHINVYYRLTTPQSFRTVDNAYSGNLTESGCVSNASRPVFNTIENEVFTPVTTRIDHDSNLPQFRILDWYQFLNDREHSKGDPNDCTHFCWHEKTFDPIWKSLRLSFDQEHGMKGTYQS